MVEDGSWSVIPGQDDAAHLPVAVILDVDETVVSNIDYSDGEIGELAHSFDNMVKIIQQREDLHPYLTTRSGIEKARTVERVALPQLS